jgi:hypothetical protein
MSLGKIVGAIVVLLVMAFGIGAAEQVLVNHLSSEAEGQHIALHDGAYGMVRPAAGSEATTRVEILRTSETNVAGKRTWSVQVRLANTGASEAPAPDFSLQLDNGKPAAQDFLAGEAPLALVGQPSVIGGPLSSGAGTRYTPSQTLPSTMLRIEPGQSVQGWLRFTIPDGSRPAHLRVSPGIGISGNLSFDLP